MVTTLADFRAFIDTLDGFEPHVINRIRSASVGNAQQLKKYLGPDEFWTQALAMAQIIADDPGDFFPDMRPIKAFHVTKQTGRDKGTTRSFVTFDGARSYALRLLDGQPRIDSTGKYATNGKTVISVRGTKLELMFPTQRSNR